MAESPTCYSYDRTSGLYLGAVSADPSPSDPGVWLYPACTTLVPPPSPGPKQAAVWRDGAWSMAPDHRGETRWLSYAENVIVDTLGEPEGSESRPPEFASLDDLRAMLVARVQGEFDAACAAHITPGSAMASVYRVQVEAAYDLLAAAAVAAQNGTAPTMTTDPSIAELVGVGNYGANELEVAETVRVKNAECKAAMAVLNGKRLRAKWAIMEALNEADARAAANVTW